MKLIFSCTLLLICFRLYALSPDDVIVVVPDENGIVYVKSGSSGDGSSWGNAVGELADAMENAKINNDIQEIWVTTGIYKPKYFTHLDWGDDEYGFDYGKYNFFPGRSNLKIYGGFTGTELNVEERILTEESLSTLSGYMDNGLRNYNILLCYEMDNFELDGFIITGAYSALDDDHEDFGAINLYNSNVIIRNCIVSQNQSIHGAGVLALGGSLHISNSRFEHNIAMFAGGGVFVNEGGTVTIERCMILNNSAGEGGCIFTGVLSHLSMNNTLIYNNASNYASLIMYHSFDFTNVTIIASVLLITENSEGIIKNSILEEGLGLYQEIPDPPIYYNSYVKNRTQEDENNNIDGTMNPNLFFIDHHGQDFRLRPNSPLINKGNNAYNDSLIDLDGNERIYGESIDIGAYESQTAPLMTYVPDDNFEQKLIDLGYDDVLDDYVVTSNIIGISNLDISSSGISDLTGIEDFISLQHLNCSYNQLNTLDLSQNSFLSFLNCSHNLLTELNFENVIELDASYNQLTSLELLGYFTKLHCNNNQLTSLNIQNWMNTEIQEIIANNNPNLTCIQVDDLNYSETNWIDPEFFLFDEWMNLSEYCEDMTTINYDYDLMSIYPNPTNDFLTINTTEEILGFEVFDLNGRTILNLNFANKTIDVRRLPQGNYLLKLYFKNYSKNLKFIKK